MKRKIKLLIVLFTLILYLMPALYFDFIAFNNAEYPQMYLYKNIEKNEYLIFLIDPLHLAIPSEETLNDKVYINNRSNTICISDII